MSRGIRLVALVVVILGSFALPDIARAQSASAIAGVVRDASGAVLPGVTVEATSPALIERSRTATTNESGQYRIVDLRPGTYTVTFSLQGFTTVVRAGILLESQFTAPLNIELPLGGVAETITVSGASPVVDVQSTSRRDVVSHQLLESLPTARQFAYMANTVPSVNTGGFDVGGSSSMWHGGGLTAHGSNSGDSRTLVDGMVADAMFPSGQCACVYDNEMQTQEIAVGVSGGAAESQLSGVIVNRIPRSGGNTFSGDQLVTFSNSAMQSNNITDELRARGITDPAEVSLQFDVNYSLGGPIIRDRVWFFFTGREWTYNNYVLGGRTADGERLATDNYARGFPLRITGNVTRNDRVTGLFNYSTKGQNNSYLTGWLGPSVVAPEATHLQRLPAEYIVQGKWTSTVTSNLLFEAGYHYTYHKNVYSYQPEVELATCNTAFALCAAGTNYGDISHRDSLLNYEWNAPIAGTTSGQGPQSNPGPSQYMTVSLAYVSGRHQFKVGYQDRSGYRGSDREINGDINQLYRNGVPFSVEVLNTPIAQRSKVNHDMGVFAQDTWTIERLTLNPGVRWDYFNASIPEQYAPAGRFVPERRFAAVKNIPNWHNVSPRFGAAYDVTGEGKTAIKGHIGMYVDSAGTALPERYNPMLFSIDTRTWNDLNQDDIAQEFELGPSTNTAFGQRSTRNMDPDLKRPFQTVWNLGVQHELFDNLGLAVTYTQRDFHRLNLLRNLAIPLTEYTRYEVPDPRGNGEMLPVYSINRSVFGQVNQIDTNSEENSQVYRGVDVSFNWRFRGASVFGGTSTGHVLATTCEVDNPNSLRFCDESRHDVPLLTSFKLSGSVPLPWDFLVSGVFKSQPGSELNIGYQVTRTILPQLTQASVTVRLNEPGSEYADRLNQLDLTVARNFRSGRLVFRPELAMFNALNAAPILTQTTIWGPNLGRVTSILNARLLRVGMLVKF
jgi:hypothetical protein